MSMRLQAALARFLEALAGRLEKRHGLPRRGQ